MRLVAALLLGLFLLLGGIGVAPRETSADAGAIAAGIAVMATGAGVSYGGCVALRATTRSATAPVPPASESQYSAP